MSKYQQRKIAKHQKRIKTETLTIKQSSRQSSCSGVDFITRKPSLIRASKSAKVPIVIVYYSKSSFTKTDKAVFKIVLYCNEKLRWSWSWSHESGISMASHLTGQIPAARLRPWKKPAHLTVTTFKGDKGQRGRKIENRSRSLNHCKRIECKHAVFTDVRPQCSRTHAKHATWTVDQNKAVMSVHTRIQVDIKSNMH